MFNLKLRLVVAIEDFRTKFVVYHPMNIHAKLSSIGLVISGRLKLKMFTDEDRRTVITMAHIERLGHCCLRSSVPFCDLCHIQNKLHFKGMMNMSALYLGQHVGVGF